MFKSDMKEAATSKIEINGFTRDVVRAFVDFIYTDTVSDAVMTSGKEELYRMAHMYDVKGLMQVCGRELYCHIAKENCIAAVRFGYIYDEDKIFLSAQKCLWRNKSLLDSEEWRELSRQYADLPTALMKIA